MLIHGDCKTELQKIEQNSIDLIYLDPPFFTKKHKLSKTRRTKNIPLKIVGTI